MAGTSITLQAPDAEAARRFSEATGHLLGSLTIHFASGESLCDLGGMARHLRVEFPAAIYHVTCRMVGDWLTEQTLLFKHDADRTRFLERLSERVEH